MKTITIKRCQSFTKFHHQVWDVELAEIAKYNTAQCKMLYDECRSTRAFYLAGQNLDIMTDTDNEIIAQSRPEKWFNEYVSADMNEIRSHRGLTGVDGYGQFLTCKVCNGKM